MRKRFKFLILAIAVLLVAALVADYLTYKPAKTPPSPAAAPPGLNSIVSALGKQLETDFPNLQLAAPDQTNTTGYQLPGYDFQVILPTSADSLTLSNGQTNDNAISSAQATAESYLERHGFKPQSTAKPAGSLFTVNFYKSPSNLCQITAYTLLDISCAPLSELSSIASQAQPLIAEYVVATGTTANAVAASVFPPSRTAGYSLATLTIYNGAGETKVNYYKGSDSWQMVNLGWYNDPAQNGSVTPNCADFESVPAIRADFAGQACYDSARRGASFIH